MGNQSIVSMGWSLLGNTIGTVTVTVSDNLMLKVLLIKGELQGIDAFLSLFRKYSFHSGLGLFVVHLGTMTVR